MTTWRWPSRLLQVRRSSPGQRTGRLDSIPAGRRLAVRSGAAILILFVLFLASASAGIYTPTGVFQLCPNTTAISQAANARLITGTAAQKTFICGIFVLAAGAENISLVGGTGTTCATGTYAIIGGTTAANGPNLLAGGQFNLWSYTVSLPPPSAAANADDICLFQSGTSRVAGVVTWVQY